MVSLKNRTGNNINIPIADEFNIIITIFRKQPHNPQRPEKRAEFYHLGWQQKSFRDSRSQGKPPYVEESLCFGDSTGWGWSGIRLVAAKCTTLQPLSSCLLPSHKLQLRICLAFIRVWWTITKSTHVHRDPRTCHGGQTAPCESLQCVILISSQTLHQGWGSWRNIWENTSFAHQQCSFSISW